MASRDDGAMMTQQLQASILSAPLASTDRRALSQAWYSALGYARQAQPPAARAMPAKSPVKPPKPAAFARSVSSEPAHERNTAAILAPRTPMRGRGVVAATFGLERRAPRTALAVNIERTFGVAPYSPARATFSVGSDGGRVHVVLQSRGNRMHLIAVCAPKQRAAVARALAQAAFALAPRGIALRSHESTEVACF
jgi:hypothetical protein